MTKTKTPEAAPPIVRVTSAQDRVNALAIQREFVRRIREVKGDLKASLKHVSSCLEAATDYLERMTDPNTSLGIFPGELVLDPKTRRLKNYRSIDDLEAEEQHAKDEASKAKPEVLDTTSKLPPKPKGDQVKAARERKISGKDAAAGEKDED